MSGFNDPFFDGVRKPKREIGCGFTLWFAFCLVLALAALAGLVYVGYEAVQLMQRH